MYKRKQKEFVCPHCQADFNKSNSLKKHIADKHNPKKCENLKESISKLQEEKGWG